LEFKFPVDFRKIITIFVATGGQILRLKCTKFYFGWGSAPDPAGERCTPPDPLAGFKGPTSKGERRERREREGRKCRVPPPTFE